MAEVNNFVLGEPNPQCQLADRADLHSAGKAPKDGHGDSLHKLLQKAKLDPHRDFAWSQPTPCRTPTPKNLFLEGFRDCASEVIRYLTEDENVENNNPYLMGLQSHLINVSKTICHENISDLDMHDSEMEDQKYEAFMSVNSVSSHNERCNVQVSGLPPCLLSPIISRSANSSESDTSVNESDISMSVYSTSEKSDRSSISDANSSLHSAQLESPSGTMIGHSKYDDVFHSPYLHYHNSASDSVLSLRHLSMNALHKISHQRYLPAGTQHHSSGETSSSMTRAGSGAHAVETSSVSQYLPTWNHSSPLPESAAQRETCSDNSCKRSPCLSITSKTETHNILQFSSLNESLGPQANPFSLLPQHSHQFQYERAQDVAESSFQNCIPFGSNNIDESQTHSDFVRQISSVLELKANFLPGIDTSSVASGNFADILLAVESCRFHEDPRVRALAEELVHLIHNDDLGDEDDDFSYDEDDNDDDDEEENMNNVNGESGFESGAEMLDESTDWGNAVDMIEQ